MGKTTLAGIIASELGTNQGYFWSAIERPEIWRHLTNLGDTDVLFIDEIRLNRTVEEILYPAMEDYAGYRIGKGPSARSYIDLPVPLVRATRTGLLTSPCGKRFGIINRLELYTHDELKRIVKRSAPYWALKSTLMRDRDCRGPGHSAHCNRLLKRRGLCPIHGDGHIDLKVTKYALKALDIDGLGLDSVDRNVLLTIIQNLMEGGRLIPLPRQPAKSPIPSRMFTSHFTQLGFCNARAERKRRAYEHLEATVYGRR